MIQGDELRAGLENVYSMIRQYEDNFTERESLRSQLRQLVNEKVELSFQGGKGKAKMTGIAVFVYIMISSSRNNNIWKNWYMAGGCSWRGGYLCLRGCTSCHSLFGGSGCSRYSAQHDLRMCHYADHKSVCHRKHCMDSAYFGYGCSSCTDYLYH